MVILQYLSILRLVSQKEESMCLNRIARGYLSFLDRLRCFVSEVLARRAGGDRAHTRRPGCGRTLFNVSDAQKDGDHKNRTCGIWKSICGSIEQVETSGKSARSCSPASDERTLRGGFVIDAYHMDRFVCPVIVVSQCQSTWWGVEGHVSIRTGCRGS